MIPNNLASERQKQPNEIGRERESPIKCFGTPRHKGFAKIVTIPVIREVPQPTGETPVDLRAVLPVDLTLSDVPRNGRQIDEKDRADAPIPAESDFESLLIVCVCPPPPEPSVIVKPTVIEPSDQKALGVIPGIASANALTESTSEIVDGMNLIGRMNENFRVFRALNSAFDRPAMRFKTGKDSFGIVPQNEGPGLAPNFNLQANSATEASGRDAVQLVQYDVVAESANVETTGESAELVAPSPSITESDSEQMHIDPETSIETGEGRDVKPRAGHGSSNLRNFTDRKTIWATAAESSATTESQLIAPDKLGGDARTFEAARSLETDMSPRGTERKAREVNEFSRKPTSSNHHDVDFSSSNVVSSMTETAAPFEPSSSASVSEQLATAVIDRLETAEGTQPGSFRIRLNPKELGAVDVQMSVVNDVVSIQLVPQDETAQQIIERRLDDLRQALVDGGITLGQCHVGNGNSGQHRSPDQTTSPDEPTSTSVYSRRKTASGWMASAGEARSTPDTHRMMNVLA